MTRFSIRLARKIFKDHFEADESFRFGYQSNIAMLLYDRYGIKDYKLRNDIALDIMDVIFDAKEFKNSGIKNIESTIEDRFELMEI